MKLYIVSNRLPVKATPTEAGGYLLTRSEGGLATGLDSLETADEKHWIGWPGICTERAEERQAIEQQLAAMHYHPVFLTEAQYKDYYEGYSNSTLWPLCHYFFAYTLYKQAFWEAYRAVNRLFAEAVARLVEPDSWVWVQDYQLMLLPALLRERFPHLRIGYFHHIPFPSYELFRILPERAQLLEGLLGADFIAFHTHDYMRHFISAAERVLHVDFHPDEAQLGNRVVRVDALPMGINYMRYHRAAEQEEVRRAVDEMRRRFGEHKLILSVDRLDYSKGILHRLYGFAAFLKHHPEYRGKVTLAMVIVPSRDQVGSYAELKTKIDEEIGSINGSYSTMDWTPVCYFYHGFPFNELVAMYYLADIALVTPLRDGMNLVAKEYVATKGDNPGVLVLSEMAGAAAELSDALLINPNDTAQIEQAILRALEMPVAEQRERMARMQAIVSTQTVNRWAADFLDEWRRTADKNRTLREKRMTDAQREAIRQQYEQAGRRLILLDYDGTLVPFRDKPEEAAPSPRLRTLLQRLSADPRNVVAINSGRDPLTLDRWLGQLPLAFAAEHGAFYKEEGVWHRRAQAVAWAPELLALLQRYVEKTPRARLEVKETALVWHYRAADAWLGALRAQQLMNDLVPLCLKQHLQVMPGNKVVEVKSAECTKGSEVEHLLQAARYDFILVMGDDTTDEDMFRASPASAITVKVGAASDHARFNLASQEEVLPFLEQLAERPASALPPATTGWQERWNSLLTRVKRWLNRRKGTDKQQEKESENRL